jgi:hypothetical protein
LIQANFRQAELGGAQEYVRKYNEHSRRLLQR